MSIGSLPRYAAISGTAMLSILLLSAGAARPSFQDGKDTTIQSNTARQPPPQYDAFEILPYPPDLAPNAKTDPELAQFIEIRASVDKAEFKQTEPVVVHYAYRCMSRERVVIMSGIPDGAHSLDVEVNSGCLTMPRTRYGTQPRTVRGLSRVGRDGRAEIRIGPREKTFSPYPTFVGVERRPLEDPTTVKGDIVVNLLRDMTNPGLYEVKVVLPVYNADFTAKARASSRTIEVRILKASEY